MTTTTSFDEFALPKSKDILSPMFRDYKKIAVRALCIPLCILYGYIMWITCGPEIRKIEDEIFITVPGTVIEKVHNPKTDKTSESFTICVKPDNKDYKVYSVNTTIETYSTHNVGDRISFTVKKMQVFKDYKFNFRENIWLPVLWFLILSPIFIFIVTIIWSLIGICNEMNKIPPHRNKKIEVSEKKPKVKQSKITKSGGLEAYV